LFNTENRNLSSDNILCFKEQTRAAAYDFLKEVVVGNEKNFQELLELMFEFHSQGFDFFLFFLSFIFLSLIFLFKTTIFFFFPLNS